MKIVGSHSGIISVRSGTRNNMANPSVNIVSVGLLTIRML
jgi:hypothetical protein